MRKNYSKWVPDNIQKYLKMYTSYPKISIECIKKVVKSQKLYTKYPLYENL